MTAVFKISDNQAEQLRLFLEADQWDIDTIQYTHWRARRNKTTCTAYQSGKLTIQGKESDYVIEKFIGPLTGEAPLPSKSPKAVAKAFDPNDYIDHIGIDESGKGDYFGPLVTAAVYVSKETAPLLLELGVQDSKNIKNDDKAITLARQIKKVVEGSYSVMTISNRRYNEMYDEIKNLNRLLAWCHATVLENVLEKEPACPQAISDQFAANKTVVERALKERGRQIDFIQRTKAEEDVAVAAASILARAEFVQQMRDMSLKLHLPTHLPKGASSIVKSLAARLYKQHGFEVLRDYAKLHFKTTREIISGDLPE